MDYFLEVAERIRNEEGAVLNYAAVDQRVGWHILNTDQKTAQDIKALLHELIRFKSLREHVAIELLRLYRTMPIGSDAEREALIRLGFRLINILSSPKEMRYRYAPVGV